MKRSNVLALVVGACLLGVVAVAQTGASPAGAASESTKARANLLFDEGKRLYDLGDYGGALEMFRQGAALEPTRGRWPYNQALALRKLKRKPEARDAFLQARAVEPGYRHAEVTQKLKELGYSVPSATPPPAANEPSTPPSETGPATPSTELPPTDPVTSDTSSDTSPEDVEDPVAAFLGLLICCGCPVLGTGGVGYAIYRLVRKKKAGAQRQGWPQSEREATVSAADLASRSNRLAQVSGSLIQVEHALRLGEDDDTRALLNQATQAEQRAYEALSRARDVGGPLSALDSALREAESLAGQAEARAQAAFGPLAFSGQGERVGCYFCARPLANSDFRVQVPLKHGDGVDTVLACRPCANRVSAGEAPEVVVRQDGGQTRHWSELPDFDPYVHRHRRYQGSGPVPAYDFVPQRSVGELAAMAAGGAVVGGLAVYGVSKLLDLHSAREAALAQAAAEAAARRASEEASSYAASSGRGFSSSSWSDRS